MRRFDILTLSVPSLLFLVAVGVTQHASPVEARSIEQRSTDVLPRSDHHQRHAALLERKRARSERRRHARLRNVNGTITADSDSPNHTNATGSATHVASIKQNRIGLAQSQTNSSNGFKLAESAQGDTFFEHFRFFSSDDPTHGQVDFVDASTAASKKLAYVDNEGNAIMKVDNTTYLESGQRRRSIRVTSTKSYKRGLVMLDVNKMPFGCSVWPAWWSAGPNWPNGGEIDIIEGVHNGKQNQMTLHTRSGCNLARSSLFTGRVVATNCDANLNSNAGCGVLDPSPVSYGAGLNNNGGGVFATLIASEGVSIWFFPRSKIPDDVDAQNPDPTSWGKPSAHWASDGCDPDSYIKAQSFIFDTTLCGDWAGATYNSAGCPGSCADRIKNPRNFDNAYWSVKSVKYYTPASSKD